MTILKKENVEGKRIYELCGKIFPICRSITGSGVRKTLSIIDDYISDTGNPPPRGPSIRPKPRTRPRQPHASCNRAGRRLDGWRTCAFGLARIFAVFPYATHTPHRHRRNRHTRRAYGAVTPVLLKPQRTQRRTKPMRSHFLRTKNTKPRRKRRGR